MGVAVGVDARLVRQALVDVAAVAVRDEPCGGDRQEDERDAGEREPDDVQQTGQASLAPPWPAAAVILRGHRFVSKNRAGHARDATTRAGAPRGHSIRGSRSGRPRAQPRFRHLPAR